MVHDDQSRLISLKAPDYGIICLSPFSEWPGFAFCAFPEKRAIVVIVTAIHKNTTAE